MTTSPIDDHAPVRTGRDVLVPAHVRRLDITGSDHGPPFPGFHRPTNRSVVTPIEFTQEGLRMGGFEGFVPLKTMPVARPPQEPGVYVLLRTTSTRPVGHWGGRRVWQLADRDACLVAWLTTGESDPRTVEAELLRRFVAQHGRRPIGNLVGGV